MNLLRVFEQFPDQASCIAHLENLRFGPKPYCPLCRGFKVARKSDSCRVGRWNCYDCGSSFNVLSGTIFQKTKIPLQKWFLAISLLLDAKKSLSSYQLSRNLNLNQGSTWYLLQRIRVEMVSKQSDIVLQGIVEADESYIGGSPSTNSACKTSKSFSGRGTPKLAVLGVVQRRGEVSAQVVDNLSAEGIVNFLRKSVNPEGSHLITDGFRSYLSVRPYIKHTVFKRYSKKFRRGIHTNTIEGFWAGFKRSWYGTHHRYSRKYAFLYVAECCYKYNSRNDPKPFETFLKDCFEVA
ncbi:MAG: IS1595 family transposase [Gammaproteobacteria bacterium]|nr:IS1595 family transposase [Gammaproteobacteria bacterium]